jgi:t-SNARE complex subunit (syntaxin)
MNKRLMIQLYEQAEPIEIIEQHIEQADVNITEGTKHLAIAESYATKFKNIFAKGALVSTGVTGVGAVTGVFLNPIAGGIGVIIGVGGIIFCITQMI